LLFSALAAGCVSAPKDHYYWGNYEALILAMYAEPGSADPVMQIERLAADLQQAESTGKPAPPGLHAHLGFLYAMNGNVSQAEAAFNEERELFPESAVFIDGMLERALQNREVSNEPPE
jgi:hypothetical protein